MRQHQRQQQLCTVQIMRNYTSNVKTAHLASATATGAQPARLLLVLLRNDYVKGDNGQTARITFAQQTHKELNAKESQRIKCNIESTHI